MYILVNKKIILTIFLLLFTVSAHAVTIYEVPEDKGIFTRVFEKISFCKWRIPCYWQEQLGVTITTINATDRISDSRSTINTDFSNLNDGKIENSTTSVAAITTLSNLVSIGTITTGTWNATTLTVAYGGTGSTTLSANQVLLGNGTGAVSVVSGLGSNGQFLTSGGAGTPPTWTTGTTDLSASNVWTSASTTFVNGVSITRATTTQATTTSLQVSSHASTSIATIGALGVGVSTTTQRNLQVAGDVQISGAISIAGTATTGALSVFSCNGCVTGWERITATGAGPTTGNDSATVSANCTAGKRVMGGGGSNNVASNVYLNGSYPADSDTWTVVYVASGSGAGANTMTAYAICVTP